MSNLCATSLSCAADPCADATLHQVDKLLGPGNQYVTAAKMLLQNSEAMVSIDMPAGPSEVLVIADGAADPAHVAADLLSQAEHGPDSQACCSVSPWSHNPDHCCYFPPLILLPVSSWNGTQANQHFLSCSHLCCFCCTMLFASMPSWACRYGNCVR